ncbi:MAG: hypothetical protein IKE20_06050, partial [Eggerthellaceae bacterium]|nr:hypothetical protein [Eggerthellaceae bacterium]
MDSYKRTYATNPELWDKGLSFLLKTADSCGGQLVKAGGWHLRQIEFEHPNVSMGHDGDCGVIAIGADRLSGEEAIIEAFELEISLDNRHDESAESLIAQLTDEATAKTIMDSLSYMNMRVSANRSDANLSDSAGEQILTVDLLCQNLPARSGDINERLRSLSRWCRVFVLAKGTITIYQPLDSEALDNLRWPHNCIWLNRPDDYFTGLTEVGSSIEAVRLPIAYESYNLENWKIEYALWENKPLQLMLRDSSEEALPKFVSVQQELGVLSQFVTTASLSNRNLQRRIDNNDLINSDERIRDMALDFYERQYGQIEDYRAELRYASSLLANSAQTVQAMADQEHASTAEQTNTIITLASALFLVPTLIISFFSMSII